MRILVVEDNSAFAHLVAERLTRSGIDSDRAGTVEQAEKAIKAVDYAAIVLDLGLPDKGGLDLLQDLRLQGDDTPVLVVTARNGLEDRIKGLREGADDYLAKPFSLDELVARLRVLLRRPGRLAGQPLTAANVALNPENHQVSVNGRVLLMRVRETVVLEFLLRNKGIVVTRHLLENQLFGMDGEQEANTVDVYIHRVRKQLAAAGASVKIHTIRGVGYMLSEDKNAQSNF
jgi:DNA-binding response OmpR family regulator